MAVSETVLAILLGVVQGALEWVPVSSEGTIALTVTVLEGERPDLATQLALFLHTGTAFAALAFYRGEVRTLLADLPEWQPGAAFDRSNADLTFFAVATVVSGVVGIGIYAALSEVVSKLGGGAFVALIGGLLVITGIVQRVAEERDVAKRAVPTGFDAVLVGVLQGLALLPGVSRSGTTVSALLLRGYEGEASLRLSFLLSIPASLGAGVLVLADEGVPAIEPWMAGLAVATSAVVGFLTVSALVSLVRRVAFWGICVGFGGLAIVGGGLLLL